LRKTTALLSATTLGVAAAAAGAVAPASADIITDPRCETFADHLDSTSLDPDADWYMECVPQYGLGKVEFTLDAPDSGFPEDFDITTADHTSSPDASGLAPYYEDLGPSGVDAWIVPAEVEDDSTPTSLHVGAALFAPVTSVGRLDEMPEAVAAACEIDDETPALTFVSNYAPVTTTFSFVGDDGVTYSAPVTATPDPTYYVFIGEESEGDPQICITDSTQTYRGDGSVSFEEAVIGLFTVPPFVWFADLDLQDPDLFYDLPSLGSFAFAAPAPDPEPEPELAATGAEGTAPLGIAAGALALLGTALTVFAARRRRIRV
jgi:hypothetical protein